MKGLCLLLLAVTASTAYIIRPVANARSCPVNSGCPKQDSPDFTVHLPYPGDCHKFYKCSAGRGCEMECPYSQDGELHLVFNPELQVCDWPDNVPNANCQDTTPTTSTSSTTSTTQSSSTSSTSTTTEPSTTSSTSTTTEPSTTSSTSTTTEPSTTSSTSTTTEPSTTSSTSTTTEPSTTSSTSTTTEPSTTSSTSTSTEPSTTSSTSTTTEPSTTSSTSTTTEPSTTSSTSTTTSTSPGDPIPHPPGKCPETGKAKVSHESDCNAYYKCKNGKRTGPYNCSQGHVFNPFIEECDVQANVDCNAIING